MLRQVHIYKKRFFRGESIEIDMELLELVRLEPTTSGLLFLQ